MPQKMIYIAESDLPLFERAQELAGTNLSATIGRAVREFVQREEASRVDVRELALPVGREGELRRAIFRGRLLARERQHTADDRLVVTIVYRTAKQQFAVYTKTIERWSAYSASDWQGWDWSTKDYRLDVYPTLEAMRPHVSADLFARAVVRLEERTQATELLDI